MNLSINNISPAFSGTMLIPTSELIKQGQTAHETMRKIGAETSKFAKPEDMQITKDGILVKIDDDREKEYQAIIAKYGVNVQKTNTPISKNDNAELATYKFMVSKLNPEKAEKQTEEYAKMNESEKQKEYLKVYQEFKKSPFANEKI